MSTFSRLVALDAVPSAGLPAAGWLRGHLRILTEEHGPNVFSLT